MNNCGYLLTTAPTLTASPRASAIYLSWNQLAGSDNVTIYCEKVLALKVQPAPTASDNTTNTVDNQTAYYLANLDPTKYYHFVIKANNQMVVVIQVQLLEYTTTQCSFSDQLMNYGTLTYINGEGKLWVRGNNWFASQGGNAEIYFSPRTSDPSGRSCNQC